MQTDALYNLSALRAVEAHAAASGNNLMQQAARAIVQQIQLDWPEARHILLLAGPGNNGGDALLAATLLLQAGSQVEVLSPVAQQSADAISARQVWQAAGGKTLSALPAPVTLQTVDLIVDGLFGIGLSRTLSPDWTALISQLNDSSIPILALDLPSGLDAWHGTPHGTAIRATETLTFLCQKPGLWTAEGPDLAGRVILAPLQHAGWQGASPIGRLNPVGPAAGLIRQQNSHKGSFGTVNIIGGCPGMLGAALLAGRAALAAGAGKVQVLALDERMPVDPIAPELILMGTATWPASDVLAIGPGLGQSEQAGQLLHKALTTNLPLILDADALNLLALQPALAQILRQRAAPSIITPHPAEAGRLAGCSTAAIQADRILAAQTLARQFNSTTILKGAGSLIVRPDGYCQLNTSGGPALANAGQGDVLTGLCAALLAQGLRAFDAASLAVLAHGMTADQHVQRQSGNLGLRASATIAMLPAVLNQLVARAQAEQTKT